MIYCGDSKNTIRCYFWRFWAPNLQKNSESALQRKRVNVHCERHKTYVYTYSACAKGKSDTRRNLLQSQPSHSARVRFQDTPLPPRKAKICENLTAPLTQQRKRFSIFRTFLWRNIGWEPLLLFSISSVNIMRCGSTTCSSCHTIVTLLFTVECERCILINGATLLICEIAKYKPASSKRWL
jgi:hypothetical protein